MFACEADPAPERAPPPPPRAHRRRGGARCSPVVAVGLLRSTFHLTDAYWAGALGPAPLRALRQRVRRWLIQLACSVVATGVVARLRAGRRRRRRARRRRRDNARAVGRDGRLPASARRHAPGARGVRLGVRSGDGNVGLRAGARASAGDARGVVRARRRERPRGGVSRVGKNVVVAQSRLRRRRRRGGARPRAHVRLGPVPAMRRRRRGHRVVPSGAPGRGNAPRRAQARVRRDPALRAAAPARDRKDGGRRAAPGVVGRGVHAGDHRAGARGLRVRAAPPRGDVPRAEVRGGRVHGVRGLQARVRSSSASGAAPGTARPKAARRVARWRWRRRSRWPSSSRAQTPPGSSRASRAARPPTRGGRRGRCTCMERGRVAFPRREAVAEGAFTAPGTRSRCWSSAPRATSRTCPSRTTWPAGLGHRGVWATVAATQVVKALAKWWFQNRVRRFEKAISNGASRLQVFGAIWNGAIWA